MIQVKESRLPRAMAFYHQDGLPSAWKHAKKFAGKGGRLATMPDIVAARLASKPGDFPWETYFTTLSAEYYGISKNGNRILIVAHGVGPMSTLDGVQKAYGYEYNDKDRNHRGGRITQQEFRDLESGKYGEVSIVDLESYCTRYEYPFIQTIRSSEALTDPVLRARFGELAEDYVKAHTKAARMWHRNQAGIDPGINYPYHDTLTYTQHERDGAENSDPYILKVDGAGNCCYFFGSRHGYRKIEEGMAIAHLLSTGCLCHIHYEGNESLTLDVGCHEWWNGVRFVGIRASEGNCLGLQQGPDAHKLLRNNWRNLLLPAERQENIGFCALVKLGKQWFTQYPKIGERMDTHEPEFAVTSAKKVGEPVLFRTASSGSGMFFKFGIKEVQAIAPSRANAYFFCGEPRRDSGGHVCEVQFYRIEADTSARLMTAEKLSRDFDLMMDLLTGEQNK